MEMIKKQLEVLAKLVKDDSTREYIKVTQSIISKFEATDLTQEEKCLIFPLFSETYLKDSMIKILNGVFVGKKNNPINLDDYRRK